MLLMDNEHPYASYGARVRSFLQTRPRVFWVVILFAVLSWSAYWVVTAPPRQFPKGETITISDGATLKDISALLKGRSVISSRLLFEAIVIVRAGEKGVLSGDYYLPRKQNVFGTARRLVRGEFMLTHVKILIPEGYTVREIAAAYSKQFPRFDEDVFLRLAHGEEGYLFPDTYRFLPNAEAPEIYKAMRDNFENKIEMIQGDMVAFGKPYRDIISMASILEREARTTETRRMIAGILWKRLSIDMPLQVDAVFPYISGKNTYELTLEDLQIDSPYNTYKYKGLPPGPIANPGLDAILAAVHPKESPYLYYLSDKDGVMHYAKTHAEHVANKARYLSR